MRVAVWRTGHEIADRVAESLARGFDTHLLPVTLFNRVADYDANIGYGILRGMETVFLECDKLGKPWFNVDRGYFKPSHYDGYYRISCRGTQATHGWVDPDYERLNALKLDLKPWRGIAPDLPVLVIPPTKAVREFFLGPPPEFLQYYPNADAWEGLRAFPDKYVVRKKGDAFPINFSDYNYVLTFNSSVGWKALQSGIPCVSDLTHSIVGSWFKNVPLDELAEKQLQDREKLFATMAASQFTLQEIEQGKAWSLIKHYTSGSAMTAGKLSPPMSPPTPSSDGLKARFQSTT